MKIHQILKQRPYRVAAAGVLAAVAVAGGTAYATSTTTVTASATDTIVRLSANTNLSSTGGTFISILKLKLPATSANSNYVIAAQGDFVDNSGSIDRCKLVVDGTEVASVAAQPFTVAAFALTGGHAVPAAGGTAALQCESDGSNSGAYVDAGASMWAHRTPSLKTGTE